MIKWALMKKICDEVGIRWNKYMIKWAFQTKDMLLSWYSIELICYNSIVIRYKKNIWYSQHFIQKIGDKVGIR